MSFEIMFTSSRTCARPMGSFAGGSRGTLSGKYSSKNSRIAMDCRMRISWPALSVKESVGTLADGLYVLVYEVADCSFLRRLM